MNKSEIIKFCKDLGCCDACCLRYLGLKNPTAYENPKEFISKFTDTDNPKNNDLENSAVEEDIENSDTNGGDDGCGAPPAKRSRAAGACVSCLGVLQEDSWPQCCQMAKDMLHKKKYECDTFACALSAPIATILRERVISLRLKDKFKDYDITSPTPLKEAWKWSFAEVLAARAGLRLHSGAVSPLLVTVNIDYPDDMQELEILKVLSPALFESRSRQKRRFAVEFTRRSVEQALAGVTLAQLAVLEQPAQLAVLGVLDQPAPPAQPAQPARGEWARAVPGVRARVQCVSVVCTHAPVYLAGRYVKLSRKLPQSPWLVGGARVVPSSVQETIFRPLADVYKMSPEEMEHRLKFLSAGREDVDVRCLGAGRPFAVEITDPRRELTAAELSAVCAEISRGGEVRVENLVYITRDDLVQLKKGEETKCKTYEALCIKLSRSPLDDPAAPIAVTERDIANINSYSNLPRADSQHPSSPRVALSQKTPIRVLHRRPLLTRTRHILELSAERVPDGDPRLFVVRAVTEAGTYIKEWVHGEAGRTAPPLAAALEARADILALDVARVHLDWPPRSARPVPANDAKDA